MSILCKPAERFANPPLGRQAHLCKCGALNHDQAEIVRIVLVNGLSQYRLSCLKCGAVTLYNLPHSRLTEAEREGARVIRRNQFTPAELRHPVACCRCGSQEDIEWHHTAPREFFADAEQWPIVSLCRRCHILWHQTMERRARVGGAENIDADVL